MFRTSIMVRSLAITVAVVATVAFSTACATDQSDSEPQFGELANAPDWVLQGCRVYWADDDGSRVCGVGSVGGTADLSLARTAAIGRARTEIARSLRTNVRAMLKDYQATTTGGAEFGTGEAAEQHIEDVAKQFTTIDLSGTALQDTWQSPKGTMFVLVSLDLETFNDSLNRMGNLSESIRRAVQKRARDAFAELDEASP